MKVKIYLNLLLGTMLGLIVRFKTPMLTSDLCDYVMRIF